MVIIDATTVHSLRRTAGEFKESGACGRPICGPRGDI